MYFTTWPYIVFVKSEILVLYYITFEISLSLSLSLSYVIDTRKPWCASYARSEPKLGTNEEKTGDQGKESQGETN